MSNFDNSRFTIHNYGITQITQKLQLSSPIYATTNKNKKFDLYNSGTKSIFGSGENYIECNFYAYDDIEALKQLKHCDIIKIDVEGAELEVIKSIFPVIEKYKPLIYIELNPHYKNLNSDIFDVLKSLGYKTLECVSDSKVYDINASQDFHDGKDYIFQTDKL